MKGSDLPDKNHEAEEEKNHAHSKRIKKKKRIDFVLETLFDDDDMANPVDSNINDTLTKAALGEIEG